MYLIAFTLVFSLLNGCSLTTHIPIGRPFENKPLIQKRNITVGVYYSKELRDKVHIEKQGLNRLYFPIGKTSIDMFNQIFAGAFERIIKLDEWPVASTSLPTADLVIAPTLERFSLGHFERPPLQPPIFQTGSPTERVSWAKIEFQIKFFPAEGEILGSRTFSGAIDIINPGLERAGALLRIPAELAIRDAASKISVAIDSDDEIRRWLRPSSLILPIPSRAALVEQKEHVQSQQIRAVIMRPEGRTMSLWDEEDDVIDCIRDSVSKAASSVKFMADDEFREKLFPWFEPSTISNTSEEMASLLSRPLVKQKMNTLGIRYLISIDGGTTDHEREGGVLCLGTPIFLAPFGGCVGRATQEREANLTATVWDIRSAEIVDAVESSARGTSFAAGFILPIWHTAKPDSAACEMLTNKLLFILSGGPR